MTDIGKHIASGRLAKVIVLCLTAAALSRSYVVAQYLPSSVCKPVGERTGDVGCWVIADNPIGKFDASPVFWYLDTFPTRPAAEAAKGSHSTVIESLGKIWLLSIESENWRPSGGERVAEIGPLEVVPGWNYSAVYLEAIFDPGMTAPTHTHSGPEAFYTLAGVTCFETPQGRQIARAGEHLVIPAGQPMHLTATGTQQRRSLVLILHESSKPPTAMEHGWAPKGLCKDPRSR
ncbi:MAG: cupin domain-containing protein [Candidatus Cybelea sp.]